MQFWRWLHSLYEAVHLEIQEGMETDGGVLAGCAIALCTVVSTPWPIQEVQHELEGLTDHRGAPRPGIHPLGTKAHSSPPLTRSKSHTKCSWGVQAA